MHRALPLFIHDDAIVAYGVDVAELTQGFTPSRVGRPSRGDETLRTHLEVKRELVVHVARQVRASEDNAEDASHGDYAVSGAAAASALPIARAYRSHEVTSARSSARPVRLS